MAEQKVPAPTRAKNVYCRGSNGRDDLCIRVEFLLLLVIICIQAKGSAAIASAIQTGGWLYWLVLAIGLGCSAFGGYVAAWIAQHNETLNELLSSFVCTAIALYSILLGRGAQSLLAQILLLAAAPAFALVGGYLRRIQKSIS
jgi:hypothetical protein